MIGTVVIVLVVLAVLVGAVLIYRAHRATIDREAERIAEQASAAAEKLKADGIAMRRPSKRKR